MSIAVEEMLHMSLSANILYSLEDAYTNLLALTEKITEESQLKVVKEMIEMKIFSVSIPQPREGLGISRSHLTLPI